MKTIGLLGGMSWESTVPYYRMINEAVKTRLGGLHSAKIVLYSVDFAEIERLQHCGDWHAAGAVLADAARALELAGADFIVLCANTMHRVAPAIETSVKIPLLHIVDVTAEAIRNAGLSRIGLLGTRFTMEQTFYRGRLEDHRIEVLTPEQEDRDLVHRVIYEELCQGRIEDVSRKACRNVIHRLVGRGAQGIVLGCTELPMLVAAPDYGVPLFDTTVIHAHAAVEAALE